MVGDLWNVKLYVKYASQIAINTFHYAVTAQSGPDLDEAVWAVNWADLLTVASLKQVFEANTIVQGITVTKVLPATTNNPYAKILGFNGLVAAGMAGTQLAALSRYTTGIHGRKGRGRTFWPFIPSAFLTVAGVLTTAARTAYNNVLAETATDYNVADGLGNTWTLSPAVYSRKGGFYSIFTSTFTQTIPCTQRRRSQENRGDSGPFG